MYRPTFYQASTENHTSTSSSSGALAHGVTDAEEISHSSMQTRMHFGTLLLNFYGASSFEEASLRAAISGADNDIANLRFFYGMFGVDPNYRHPKLGVTALHCATQKGHLNVVRFLLHKCSANPNILDAQNRHALRWAVATEDEAIKLALCNEYIRVMQRGIPVQALPRKRVEKLVKKDKTIDTDTTPPARQLRF